jgi:hypothetical protein
MSFDLSATANVLLERLGAASWTDLDWCSQSEVYGWFDEAQSRLAELGLFVALETLATEAAVSAYALPADWLRTIFAAVNASQVRPASVAELQALDSGWAGAVCAAGELPSRYALDAGSLGTLTLYPQPGAVNTLELIDQITPPDITATQTSAPIPSVVSDYFLYFALQRARGKESPNAMPEVAAAAAQMVALLEQAFQTLWGGQ